MQVQGAAFALNTNYQRHRSSLTTAMQRLASGDRFVRAGVEPAANLSISQRFRNQIKGAEASTNSLQTASAFLDTTYSYAQTTTQILQRMMELATAANDDLKSTSDREIIDSEFQALKKEVSEMSRNNLFFGKQTIGREALVSFDANSNHIKFWQSTGNGEETIQRDFSSSAIDSSGNIIGFDSSEDFSMSRDGKSLFYFGTESGDPAGNVRIKRYDIENHKVYTGSTLFDSQDTLFVDETGDLYVNGQGTFYTVDEHSLDATATAITDGRAAHQFSVYKGDIIYSRSSDSAIVSGDTSLGTATALTGALTFGSGVDHSFSHSGRYVAEESSPGQIRVIDTRSSNEATINIGTANSVTDLHFNADGDRLYYINKETNSIDFIHVGDDNGVVNLYEGGKVVQGVNANSFNGLDLGGSSYSSSIKAIISQDTTSQLTYEAVDLSLYALGLATTHVDTLEDSSQAMDDIKTAMNRVSAAQAKIGAMASRFRFAMSSHKEYISSIKEIESQIRDVDVAYESTIMSSEQVKESAAMAVISQFNTISRNVLVLLQ